MSGPTVSQPALKGTELGYVEKADADFTTASTSLVDVTGVTVTVTVGARPILVRAGGSFFKNNNAGGLPVVQITQGASTKLRSTEGFAANAGQQFPFGTIERRLSLAAGSYTFKLQAASIVAGTTTLTANANDPLWLQVIEV